MSLYETLVDTNTKAVASRQSFGLAVAELGDSHPEMVVLDADLSKSTQTQHFAKKFPERFFNMGIAEANMIGAAAGLARAGHVPFAASFACFLTGRYDQIRMSVAASKANVKLVGTHAGVGIGEDGHSQMGLEDLTLMRSLPNMTVFQPSDDWDTREFIKWSIKHDGPVYMRLTRQGLPLLKRPAGTEFKPGVWGVLNPEVLGSADVVLMASGGVMEPSVKAAEILSEKSLKVCVVNANWIRPIDEAFLRKACESSAKLLVTVEDHYDVGGLGGAVAEFISTLPNTKRLLRIGVTEFGQSGSPADNMEHYGFTGEKISARIASSLG
ncbi:transketolase family protein [bacterium]|nr:transketolase family protein [bacterium]